VLRDRELAAGRPVVVQDTGFRDWFEADGGVLSFQTPEEAAEALRELCAAYDRHARAAREVAAEYFAAERVLPHLLERCFAHRPLVAEGMRG
jgi:hypothetical protein